MTSILMAGLLVWVVFKSRTFLAKAWLAFGVPLAEKLQLRAERAVVEAGSGDERPLSRRQVEDIRGSE